MYAVGQNEAPRLPARVRVNGAPADAVLWLDAVRAARPLPSPSSAPTVAEGAAGNLTGAYRWLVAFGSAVMVSYPSPVSALLTVTAKRVNLSVVPTSTDGRVTKRRIYRTLAGGSVYKLVGEIADNVTTDFEDNVADGALTDEYLAVTVFADGDPTDEYADRGRYGYHAIQATPAARPLWRVGILNGRPVVRFDGTDDFLRTVAFATALAQPNVIFMVADINANTQYAYYDGLAGDARHFFITNGGGANQIRLFAGDSLDLAHTHPASQSVWRAVWNGANSSLFKNGASVGSGDVGIQSLDGLTIGANYADTAVLSGDIAEILILNRALADAECKRVDRYLSRKYGITLTG